MQRSKGQFSWGTLFSSIVVLVLSGSVQATIVAPGNSVGGGTPTSPGTLDVFSDTPVLVDQMSTPVATPTYSGTLTSAVYTNTGGTLDFYYQFRNDISSADGIERLSMTSFAGFTTDVGYRTTSLSPFVAGSADPLNVDRSVSGSVVGFNFISTSQGIPSITPIDPGQSSRVLVIRTNATQYFIGNTAIIDGFAANAPSFAPVPIPEPATAGFVALGLGAMTLRRRS